MTDLSITFDHFNFVAADMEATIAFYRRLGIEVSDLPNPWKGRHRSAGASAGVAIDFDSQEFAQIWNQGADEHTQAVFNFGTTSREAVDEIYTTMTAAGYASQQPPYDAFWGSRYAVVVDPDGRSVGLMSPRSDAHRSPPPE